MERCNLIDAKDVASAFRDLRQQAQLTQGELAYGLGYDTRTIRRLEKDGTDRLEVVNAYARFFQVNAIDILAGCLFFYGQQTTKKDGSIPSFCFIGGFRHTRLTPNGYSHTCTLV